MRRCRWNNEHRLRTRLLNSRQAFTRWNGKRRYSETERRGAVGSGKETDRGTDRHRQTDRKIDCRQTGRGGKERVTDRQTDRQN